MKIIGRTKQWGGSKGIFPLNIFDKSFYIFLYKRLIKKNISVNTYAGKKLHSAVDGNAYIKDMIISGTPFAAGKIGDVELYVAKNFQKKHLDEFDKFRLFYNAGFFPNDEELMKKFGREYCRFLYQMDIVGCWYNRQEDSLIKKSCEKDVYLAGSRCLEPYYFSDPWSVALKGKKVLVVNPFIETICKQYNENRSSLFKNPDILPEFELLTYRSVQTIGDCQDNRFNTWFEALDNMINDIKHIDFDIALVGCGAYGIPLCVKIKELGKQAIHMGGSTQILFGIKGKRWDNHDYISKLYNRYWIRPLESEIPNTDKGPKAYI